MARYLRRKAGKLRDEGALADDVDVLACSCFIHKAERALSLAAPPAGGRAWSVLDNFYPGPGWALDVDPMTVL